MPRRDKAVYTKAIDKKGDYEIYSTKSKQLLGKIKGVNNNRNSYWEALDTDGNCMFQGGRKKECLNYFCDLEEKRLMAKGGGLDNRILVVLDEGNGKVINDLYTQWNNIKNDKDQANWNEKVKATTFGTYGVISIKEVLEKFEFDKSEKINSVSKQDFKNELNQALKYGKGGGIGFEKLSKQVAKEYEGDKVAPEYQGEYGKTYSREEAQEVGDKVAGKVYWQQRGRKFGEGGEPSLDLGEIVSKIKTEYPDVEPSLTRGDKIQVVGIGKSDLLEIDKKFFDGKADLIRLGGRFSMTFGLYYPPEMAHGGEVDDDDCGCDDDQYATGGSIESTRLKYAKKDIALLMKQGAMAIFGTKHGLLNLSYEDGVFTISDNNYNSRTESYNVLFEGDKKGAIDFVANSYVVEGFGYGGSMSSSPKTYYIILNDGSKKEFNVKHPKEINGIYFAMGYDRGADSIAKGTPMVHFENALNPLYNADGTPAEAMPQYAGKDYNDLKGQMAEGGNIYSKEESMNIARTILQQMGGRARLEAFTGAYNFAIGDGAVMFRIKNRGVNFVKVKLNGSDLYDVTFGRISGTNYKVVEELDDVYAEDLIDIFEKSTGMYLRFEDGGMMAKGGGVGNEKKKDIISFVWQTRTFQGDKEPLEDIIRKTFNIERRFPPILNFNKSAMELEFTEYVSEDELKSEQYKTDLFKKVQAVKSKIEGLYNLSVNYYTNDAESWNNFENSIVITIGEKKNYDEGSTFFAKGGNLSPSDSDSYYRWRMKKFGFKPYGKEKGRFKITYVADGEPQEEITTTKEMAIDTAKRYTKLFEDVKIFDGSGSEIKYEKGGDVFNSEFYKDGGEVGFSLKNDTKYVRSEDIQEVRLTNGKKIFNYEKWYGSQRNYGESVDNIFSGLYVAKRPFESKEQYKMFKDGGNLPESAKYIKRSELESVIINDENGEEKEIPANRIVNGIWYDNQRNEALIERAKKEGLLKK